MSKQFNKSEVCDQYGIGADECQNYYLTEEGSLIHKTAMIGKNAKIIDSLVKKYADIGCNTVIKHSYICDWVMIWDDVTIGEHTTIDKRTLIHKGCNIGSNVIISEAAIIDAKSIGDGSYIGQGVLMKESDIIVGSNVHIGDYCIIGADVEIKDGVTIHDGAIIESGEVIGRSPLMFYIDQLVCESGRNKIRIGDKPVELSKLVTNRDIMDAFHIEEEGKIVGYIRKIIEVIRAFQKKYPLNQHFRKGDRSVRKTIY